MRVWVGGVLAALAAGCGGFFLVRAVTADWSAASAIPGPGLRRGAFTGGPGGPPGGFGTPEGAPGGALGSGPGGGPGGGRGAGPGIASLQVPTMHVVVPAS
jgi:hypothetical protein